MERKQISGGLVLSYALIVINSIYGLFVTPFILAQIGKGDYGVYKTIASFSSSLAVVDLGIGSTVIRYISLYRATGEKKKLENYSAMALGEAVFLAIVLALISAVCYGFLPAIYSNKFTNPQLERAKQLFVILIFNTALNIVENVFFGIISGSNKFIFANTVKLMRVVMRIVMIYALLSSFKTSITIVFIDTGIVIVTIIIELVYMSKSLHLMPKFHYFDKPMFKESMKYSLLLFLQTVVVQFNGNIDNILIGAYIGAEAVTVYSIGLQLYNMYEHFATAFSNLMLPSVTKQVVNGDDNSKLEDTVIKVGRFQFIFLGAVLAGFIAIGKEFITLWVGSDYLDAWTVGVILMVPTMIPLIQNVCLAIIRAKNKLGFRTIMVTVMAVINFVITLIGVKYFGYIYAAVGTAIGLIVANVIAMNIYYYKVLGINVFRIFKEVFSKTWICVLIPAVVIFFLKRVLPLSVMVLILLVAVFVVIYAVLLIVYGLNGYERDLLKRFRHKKA